MRVVYSLTILGLLFVIVVGAYTRINDAGLGCPDWPGCYGHVVPPYEHEVNVEKFDTAGFDKGKAWIEMWHRYFAGTIGLVVISLALQQIIKKRNLLLSTSLILLVFLQANLGRLTVTMKLQPIIVSLHLIGGLSLLLLMQILSYRQDDRVVYKKTQAMPFLFKGLVAIYFVQLVLGAWVSTNYAGLACQDFPSCQLDSFFPAVFSERFLNFSALWASVEPLSFYSNADKQWFHLIHRANAFLLGFLFLAYYKRYRISFLPKQKVSYLFTFGVYLLQLTVGILLIYLRLPVSLATLHNFLAALMGVGLVAFYYSDATICSRKNLGDGLSVDRDLYHVAGSWA